MRILKYYQLNLIQYPVLNCFNIMRKEYYVIIITQKTYMQIALTSFKCHDKQSNLI